MNEPKVSIIIPVYNVEKYLQRCIDSLRAQTYTNTEMIFVDDGSTDSSYQILQQAEKTDSRIRVFSQENAGPSAARNLGMDHCNGEYIMFCDSDDTVEPTWTEKMVEAIHKYPDSLVTCGFRRLDETGNTLKVHTMPSGLYDKSEYFQYYHLGLSGSSCIKIYRKDIILNNGLRFDSDCWYAEDAILNLDYLDYVKEIFILCEPLYNYYAYCSMDTLSRKVSYWQLRKVFCRRAAYIEQKYLDQYNKEFFFFAWNEIEDIFQNKALKMEKRVKYVQQIVADSVFQDLLKAYGDEVFDRYSLRLMKIKAVRSFWLIQKIHQWKNDFKRKVK